MNVLLTDNSLSDVFGILYLKLISCETAGKSSTMKSLKCTTTKLSTSLSTLNFCGNSQINHTFIFPSTTIYGRTQITIDLYYSNCCKNVLLDSKSISLRSLANIEWLNDVFQNPLRNTPESKDSKEAQSPNVIPSYISTEMINNYEKSYPFLNKKQIHYWIIPIKQHKLYFFNDAYILTFESFYFPYYLLSLTKNYPRLINLSILFKNIELTKAIYYSYTYEMALDYEYTLLLCIYSNNVSAYTFLINNVQLLHYTISNANNLLTHFPKAPSQYFFTLFELKYRNTIYISEFMNKKADGEEYPIFSALQSDKAFYVTSYLNLGASLLTYNNDGDNGISYTITHNQFPLFSIIMSSVLSNIKRNEYTLFIDSTNRTGKTLIMIAIENENEKIIQYLLDHHCNLKIADEQCHNAFYYALINKKLSSTISLMLLGIKNKDCLNAIQYLFLDQCIQYKRSILESCKNESDLPPFNLLSIIPCRAFYLYIKKHSIEDFETIIHTISNVSNAHQITLNLQYNKDDYSIYLTKPDVKGLSLLDYAYEHDSLLYISIINCILCQLHIPITDTYYYYDTSFSFA